MSGPDPKNPEKIAHDLWGPCSPGDPKGTEKSWMDIPGDKLREPEVDFNMILRSLTSQKKTVNDEDLEKLSKFAADFGQDGWFKVSNLELWFEEIKRNVSEREKYTLYLKIQIL